MTLYTVYLNMFNIKCNFHSAFVPFFLLKQPLRLSWRQRHTIINLSARICRSEHRERYFKMLTIIIMLSFQTVHMAWEVRLLQTSLSANRGNRNCLVQQAYFVFLRAEHKVSFWHGKSTQTDIQVYFLGIFETGNPQCLWSCEIQQGACENKRDRCVRCCVSTFHDEVLRLFCFYFYFILFIYFFYYKISCRSVSPFQSLMKDYQKDKQMKGCARHRPIGCTQGKKKTNKKNLVTVTWLNN